MIVPDTNILGTFARVNALDLLFDLFGKEEMGIVPAVYAELVAGLSEGRNFLQAVVRQVDQGRLKLFALSADEVIQRQNLPTSLADGEAESITVCLARSGAFLTNDRRARNFARKEGIEVFDLSEVLRSLWKLGICSKQKIRQLVADIENKEGMVIKHKERIFAK